MMGGEGGGGGGGAGRQHPMRLGSPDRNGRGICLHQ